jgi:hypothetical protein
MTVEDYVASPADNYKFMAEADAKAAAAAKPAPIPASVPASTPAAATAQPPKP